MTQKLTETEQNFRNAVLAYCETLPTLRAKQLFMAYCANTRQMSISNARDGDKCGGYCAAMHGLDILQKAASEVHSEAETYANKEESAKLLSHDALEAIIRNMAKSHPEYAIYDKEAARRKHNFKGETPVQEDN